MAKKVRKAVTSAALRSVKTSVVLDSHLHSRISALASLRGCTISALLEEAAREATRGITVIDRRKVPGVGVVADDGDPSSRDIGEDIAA